MRRGKLLPIEIKSGKTSNFEFFRNIEYWKKLSKAKKSPVLYTGDLEQKRSSGTELLNWKMPLL